MVYNDLGVFDTLIRHSNSLIIIRNSTALQHLLHAFIQMELDRCEERLCSLKCGSSYKRNSGKAAFLLLLGAMTGMLLMVMMMIVQLLLLLMLLLNR